MFFIILLSAVFLFGVVFVAVSKTPIFSAGVLGVSAGIGCGLLAMVGNFFLALTLFLVYLGGMLVVFGFCVWVTADSFIPREVQLVDVFVFVGYTVVCFLVSGWGVMFGGGHWQSELELVGNVVVGLDSGFGGVCELYSFGGWYLFVAGWVLLLTLFVVLELVRGSLFGALKGLI